MLFFILPGLCIHKNFEVIVLGESIRVGCNPLAEFFPYDDLVSPTRIACQRMLDWGSFQDQRQIFEYTRVSFQFGVGIDQYQQQTQAG